MAEERVAGWVRVSSLGLGVVVLVQLGIGFYLNSGYVPTPEGAADSMRAYRDLGLPEYLQNVHYWGSAWLIVHSFIHLFLLLVSGAYLKVSKSAWLGSVVLFGSAFLMQVTGNLLPFDQHDVQTAVVEGGIAGRVPLLGDFAASSMLRGESFGPATLEAWHKVHLWLIVPMVIAALMGAFGGSALSTRSKGFGRFAWVLPLAAIAAISFAAPAPWGTAATPEDYRSFDALPSWYTWPMHGAMNAFEKISPSLGWLGTVVLPGLFAGVLMLAPWLGGKRDRLVRGALLGLIAAFGVLGVLFGGSPAPAWGKQEVAESAPSTSQSAAKIDEALAARGFELAKKNCAGCHGATLAGGRNAPDLTGQFKRHSDADYFKRFIKKPQSVKKGSTMPSFEHLPEEQIAAMAEWLRQEKA